MAIKLFPLGITGEEVKRRLNLAVHNSLFFDSIVTTISPTVNETKVTSASNYTIVYLSGFSDDDVHHGIFALLVDGTYYINWSIERGGETVTDSAWYNNGFIVRSDRTFICRSDQKLYIYDNTQMYRVTNDGTPGTPGSDGITPHIDPTTKHWMIGDEDTGILAEGKDGEDGKSAYQTWLETDGLTAQDKTEHGFLVWLQDRADNYQGPFYAATVSGVTQEGKVYYVPGPDSDKYRVMIFYGGESHVLATRSGMLSNYTSVYDISAANDNTPYSTLQQALAAITDDSVKKGGMTIKFIQGTGADAKYVQYRLLRTTFPSTYSADDWQGMDDEPTVNSNNLVKSGGIFVDTINKAFKSTFDKSDFEVHTYNTSGSLIDNSSYNRIRMIYPVVPGMHVEAQCSEGKGVDIVVQPLDLNIAIQAKTTTKIQQITAYTLSKVSGRIETTGFLVVSLCKTNDSNFTASEKASYIAATTIALRKEVPSTEITKDSSYVAFYPEIEETDKALNKIGGSYGKVGYKYSKPFNLEAGDVVILDNSASSDTDYVTELSKYNNGTRSPLYIAVGNYNSQQEKYYFISDKGQYVLCCRGTLKCSIAKHIPLRFAYDALFTKLRTTDNLTLSKEDFQIHNVVTTASTYRLRLSCPIPKGSRVIAACSLGKGVAVSIYNNETQVYSAFTDYLETFSSSYVSNVDAIAHYDGYLVVSLCKNDDTSEFTPQDIEDYLAATTITVTHNVKLNSQEENKHELFLGQLINKALTATGLSDTNADKRVSTVTCMVVPKEAGTISFVLPSNIYVGIRSGNESSNLSNNHYWMGNGDTYTFGADVHYYRLCFANVTNGNPSSPIYGEISTTTVMDYIQNGSIKIFVENWENDIIKQNSENEKYIKAVMRHFVSGPGNNGSLHKLPIFAHTSDVHGDANRFKNFADYCDYIGVNAALVSGDTVATNSVDSMQYINDIMDSHNTKILICMGNHDARNLMTAQEQYDTILAHDIQKYGVETNSEEDYPTYYYYDFAAKKIRLISLNLYELNHSVDTANFTQRQCEWFISALASTPQGYGILVMFHSPEKMPEKDVSHTVFYQNIVNYTGLQAGITGNPFTRIIDAFIGRQSTTITYTSNNQTGNPITVTTNFATSVASGVEFIAFVNGHLHVDRIGYIPETTYKQLNLNVCCGVAIYGSTYPYLTNNSDMPRGCNGVTQDCFNIYAIDRTTKTVRIAKVGSNVSGDLVRRDYMAIPYAD